MALAETAMQVVGVTLINIGMPTQAMLSAAGLTLLLGALVGLVAAPCLAVRGGRWLHLAAMLAIWLGLLFFSRIPAEATSRRLTWAVFVAGVVFLLVGRLLSRRWPMLPAPLALALVAVVLAVPALRARGLRNETAAASSPGAPTLGAPIAEAAAAGAPDVLLMVLDTVRADHVGAYGYPRQTTPNLDRLAAEGVLYVDATAPATWSLPSHASLFTGRFPSGHQAHHEHRFLDAAAPTLAETLGGAGYETLCFTANAWISDTLGLTRGFSWSDEAWRQNQLGRSRVFVFRLLDRLGFGLVDKGGHLVVSNFEEWLAERPADAPPAFVFMNLIEAHFPYHQVPAEYLTMFSDSSPGELRELSLELMEANFGGSSPSVERALGPATDMYDAGLRYADHLLGRVVDALRRRGSLDDTVLIVMADHGEMLGDHAAWGHGHTIYEAESRVPLVLRFPPLLPAGTRVSTPISTVGVYASILDLLDLDAPPTLQVQSLLPAIAGGSPGGPVMSERYAGNLAVASSPELQAADPMFRSDRRFRSYRVGSRKLVESSEGSPFLFDLARDPGESRDVLAQHPDDLTQLRGELADWQAAIGLPPLDAAVGGGEAPELDGEARERLRALGYVN